MKSHFLAIGGKHRRLSAPAGDRNPSYDVSPVPSIGNPVFNSSLMTSFSDSPLSPLAQPSSSSSPSIFIYPCISVNPIHPDPHPQLRSVTAPTTITSAISLASLDPPPFSSGSRSSLNSISDPFTIILSPALFHTSIDLIPYFSVGSSPHTLVARSLRHGLVTHLFASALPATSDSLSTVVLPCSVVPPTDNFHSPSLNSPPTSLIPSLPSLPLSTSFLQPPLPLMHTYGGYW